MILPIVLGTVTGAYIGDKIINALNQNEKDNKNTSSTNKNNKEENPDYSKIAQETFNREVDIMQHYNPYRQKENEEPFIKGIPFIFITTPYLNLGDINTEGTFLHYLKNVEPRLLASLSYGYGDDGDKSVKTSSPFIKLLTNKFKGIDIKDLTARALEINETFYGYKQMFTGPIIESITGDELTVSYGETKNLSVLKLHKAWIEYIEHIRRGEMKPANFTRSSRFIDYSSSLYYFLLDFDMETILYFSKFTGLMPLTVPLNVAGMEVGNPSVVDKLDITYMYMAKEDLDINIIMDFNLVAQNTSQIFAYDTSLEYKAGNELIPTDKWTKEDKEFDIEDSDQIKYKNVKIVKKALKDYNNANTGYSSADGMKNFVFKLKFY